MKNVVLEAIHLNNAYTGNGMYMGFYFLVLVFIMFDAREKKMRIRIAYPAVIMLFFILALAPFLNEFVFGVYNKDTGGRLFWLLFVTIIVSYGATRLIQLQDGYMTKALLVLVMVPIIFLSGVFKLSNALYHPIENEYRLPQYGIDICDVVLEAEEEPKLLVPYEIAHIFRQYSTKIKLLYGEDASYGRIQPVFGTEYHKACQEMDSTSPDVSFVATLAYRENCDFIIFDTDYHVLKEKPENYGYEYYESIEHFDLYRRREFQR